MDSSSDTVAAAAAAATAATAEARIFDDGDRAGRMIHEVVCHAPQYYPALGQLSHVSRWLIQQ